MWITNEGKLAVVAALGNRGIFRLYDPTSFEQQLEKELAL